MAEERSRRKSGWVFYVVLGLIVLALPVAYALWFSEGTPPPPPPPPPVVQAPIDAGTPEPPKAVELRLADVGGTVEVSRGNAGWVPARKGEVLKESDAVRTGKDTNSYALLIGGEAVEVKMSPGTEMSVGELTHEISRVMLAEGVATAQVKGGGRHTFEVRAKGSDAVARTGEGSFAISNNAGTVAVGTQSGQVELAGGGSVVIVRAGEKSVAYPNQAPSQPAPIPSDLLLKVEWPSERDRNRKNREILVEGETEPGAVLLVAGQAVPVRPDGKFAYKMKLVEGPNSVEVTARSINGVAKQAQADFTLKTKVGTTTVTPKWE
jgi:hypothetical protein